MRQIIAEVRKLVKQARKSGAGIVTIIMSGLVLLGFSLGEAPVWMWPLVWASFATGIVIAVIERRDRGDY